MKIPRYAIRDRFPKHLLKKPRDDPATHFILRCTISPDYWEVHPAYTVEGKEPSYEKLGMLTTAQVAEYLEEL